MRRALFLAMVAALAAVTVAGTTALARGGGDKEFEARLTGFQEVPSLSTTGRGSFEAKVKKDSIEYELRYRGLSAPALQSHIHLGQRGVAGDISAFLCGGDGKPACPPGTSDTAVVKGTIVAADVIGPTDQGIEAGELDEVLRALRRGFTYANVHTSTFPPGEIRGQIKRD